MIELSREIAAFAPIVAKYVRGEPGSLLLVEFAGDEAAPLARKLDELDETMASLGFANAVVKLTDAAQQAEMWEVRAAGLNIMTSMRGDAKPVSIIEDCAVPLNHLADYTERLNAHLREVRDHRHVLRARVGRLPARAAGAQHEARRGRRQAARDRRGGVRDRARVRRRALGRARRRDRALGVPRGDVRAADRRGVPRREARVRPRAGS